MTDNWSTANVKGMLPHQRIFKFLCEKKEVPLFPLQTIEEGLCSCGNPKCTAPGKHPIIRRSWKKVFTRDIDKICAWHSQYDGKLNYAAATGKLETLGHLVVLDFDIPSHPIMRLLPTTFSYRTGGDGRHFWFISQEPVQNSASAVAPNLDIRGEGGYVIIPPSKHVSGLVYRYDEDFSYDIAPLPNWLLSKLKNVKSGSITRQGTGKQDKDICQEWIQLPVQEIRNRLDAGEQIPNGLRNTTIHRLLSSDRAKGTFHKKELWLKAQSYRLRAEEHKTITDNELSHIVSSVMKYAPYNNNDTSTVISSYVKFMNKKVQKVEENDIEKINNDFWASLQKIDDKMEFISLIRLMKEYEGFFISNGIDNPPKYKSQLFAKKLTEMGFSRYRTSNGNLWNAKFSATIH